MRHTTHRNENLLLLCMAHLHPSDLEEKNRKTVHIPQFHVKNISTPFIKLEYYLALKSKEK